MIGRFDAEHDVYDLASELSVGLEGVAIARADEHQLPGLKGLRCTVDPMARAAVLDQEHLEEVVVMRLVGKALCKVLAGEVKGFVLAQIASDAECLEFHAPRLRNKTAIEQSKYQSCAQKCQILSLRTQSRLLSLVAGWSGKMLDSKLDLRFRPVENPGPKALNASDIDQFNTLGFVQPFDVFSSEEMANMRAYLDGLMSALGPDGAYGINCYQARLSGLWDIATDARIVDLVSDLIGPDVLCWATAILSKSAGDPKRVPWHQDASFWKLSPARTVTVWLAIDDADEDNSAMRFIPGTHDKGALPTSERGEGSVFHMGTANAEAMGQPFTNVLKAGQVSLHADMLVHGSLPNVSERRRCGLTLRYCPPEVQITDPEWANGVEAILCRGNAGNWNTHPRPDNNDITKTTSPHVVGNN